MCGEDKEVHAMTLFPIVDVRLLSLFFNICASSIHCPRDSYRRIHFSIYICSVGDVILTIYWVSANFGWPFSYVIYINLHCQIYATRNRHN